MDCREYGGLELGLQWTVEYTEDWYWVYSGLKIIRSTSTGSVVKHRIYRGWYWSVIDCKEGRTGTWSVVDRRVY